MTATRGDLQFADRCRLFLVDEPHQTPQHDARHLWSSGIDFAVPALRSVQQPRWLIVPLSFRNQVTQLIVAQAEYELVSALQMCSQDRFKGGVRIVRSGITSDAAVSQ